MPGPPSFGGFADVDATAAPERYAAYLEAARGVEAVREWKARSIDLLEPRPGLVLLDAGCGTGEDVRALAERVAPGGRAIGVDASEEMVAEAVRRGHGPACEFRRDDLRRLGMPGRSVDGCRAERVLQHLDAPDAAVRELVRVLRPGGRVVLAEPDWGTLVIDGADPPMSEEVARAAAAAVRSGTVGRRLRRLLVEEGLSEVDVVARTLVLTDPAAADGLLGLHDAAARAVSDGRVTAAQATRWRAGLTAAARAGTFLAAMTAFMAWGRRGPDPDAADRRFG